VREFVAQLLPYLLLLHLFGLIELAKKALQSKTPQNIGEDSTTTLVKSNRLINKGTFS